MNPDTHHPDYDMMLSQWRTARDVLAGEHAVKLAGETYLPKLLGHTREEYLAYKLRCFALIPNPGGAGSW